MRASKARKPRTRRARKEETEIRMMWSRERQVNSVDCY